MERVSNFALYQSAARYAMRAVQKIRFVTGHDFSRAEIAIKQLWALAPAKNNRQP
jgi:hypothetical protein